jgi:hypothetical protein
MTTYSLIFYKLYIGIANIYEFKSYQSSLSKYSNNNKNSNNTISISSNNDSSYLDDESDTILHKHISNSYDDNTNTNTNAVDLLQYNDISIYIQYIVY